MKAAQSTDAISHKELFRGQECLEKLNAAFFKMYENVSKKLGNEERI